MKAEWIIGLQYLSYLPLLKHQDINSSFTHISHCIHDIFLHIQINMELNFKDTLQKCLVLFCTHKNHCV